MAVDGKETRYELRLTTQRKQSWQAAAKASGMPLSVWITMQCDNAVRTNDSCTDIKQPIVRTEIGDCTTSVRTKRINTPAQAKQAVSALEGVSMSMSDAKALRLQRFLANQ